MAKAGLAWINHIDTAVLTTDSQVATLPLANVADPHLATKWRTTTTTAFMAADWGAVQEIGVVGLFGSNFTAAATWRIRLSAVAAGAGELLDTGVVAAGVAAGYGQAVHVLAAAVNARYLRIDLADSGLAALGYFQIGAAWAGRLWTPERNFRYGAAPGWRDPSVKTLSRGGQAYVDLRDRIRAIEFELPALTEAELLDAAFEIDRVAGVGGNILFVPDPGAATQNRRAILGTLDAVEAAPMIAHDRFAHRYVVAERR